MTLISTNTTALTSAHHTESFCKWSMLVQAHQTHTINHGFVVDLVCYNQNNRQNKNIPPHLALHACSALDLNTLVQQIYPEIRERAAAEMQRKQARAWRIEQPAGVGWQYLDRKRRRGCRHRRQARSPRLARTIRNSTRRQDTGKIGESNSSTRRRARGRGQYLDRNAASLTDGDGTDRDGDDELTALASPLLSRRNEMSTAMKIIPNQKKRKGKNTGAWAGRN